MPVERIVCLAKSKKFGGSCVAGVEILANGSFGRWIRPVSTQGGGAISAAQQICTNRQPCHLLDVIDIDFAQPVPVGYQSENMLINRDWTWSKIYRLNRQQLAPLIHNGLAPIWPHTESTNNGDHDKIPVRFLPQITSSLALVCPQTALVQVTTNPFKNKLDVRVRFTWGTQVNTLKLTDPVQLATYRACGSGHYPLNLPIMCISIGEVFGAQNAAFKLVASIIP